MSAPVLPVLPPRYVVHATREGLTFWDSTGESPAEAQAIFLGPRAEDWSKWAAVGYVVLRFEQVLTAIFADQPPLPPELATSRRFVVFRRGDLSETHGAGTVNAPEEAQFEGIVFSDGTCVIRWLTAYRSTSVWASFAEAMAVHGHFEPRYGTELRWIDPAPDAAARPSTDATAASPDGSSWLTKWARGLDPFGA